MEHKTIHSLYLALLVLMIATLDRLLALSRKLHTAKIQSESEPIYVSLDLNELQLLKRLADDYLEESETVLYESDQQTAISGF